MQTGWLDGTYPGGENGWDLRVIESAGGVDLAPGETVVLTAVLISADETDLAASLGYVRSVMDRLKREPQLWRFPVSP